VTAVILLTFFGVNLIYYIYIRTGDEKEKSVMQIRESDSGTEGP